jgi:catechol 2,3-dioxygenase
MGYQPKYLGHVNIFVRDAERSRAWYEEVLGLHAYEIRKGAAFLSADREQSHEVALFEVGADAQGPQKGQVGLNHMAWMMASLDDLAEFYRRLKERGVAIERITDHGISLGIYLRDPDGNGVEVSYELPRDAWPRQEHVFSPDIPRGRFPGPWDSEVAPSPYAAQ